MHLFTGSNGLSVGQPPVLDNTEPDGGYGWMTAGEVLEEAGIDWKVLKMEDDFDDNAFAVSVGRGRASVPIACTDRITSSSRAQSLTGTPAPNPSLGPL